MIIEPLRVFVTVAEQQHFSRAAELLNLSQPGVSLQIRSLEQEIGSRLLHRTPKQVKLTEAGEILFRHARQMLELYAEARQEIDLLTETVSGALHIGASFTIGEYLLPRALAEFAGQYPGVEMQITIGNTEEIVRAVRGHSLDLGLVEGTVGSAELDTTPFMRDEMILVAAPRHPLASVRAVTPALLQDQIWVLRENGSGTRAFSDEFIQSTGLHVKRTYIFNSSQGVKATVAAGLGIALLSRWVVRRELNTGELVELPMKGPRLGRSFTIIQEPGRTPTMAAKIFSQSLGRIR